MLEGLLSILHSPSGHVPEPGQSGTAVPRLTRGHTGDQRMKSLTLPSPLSGDNAVGPQGAQELPLGSGQSGVPVDVSAVGAPAPCRRLPCASACPHHLGRRSGVVQEGECKRAFSQRAVRG